MVLKKEEVKLAKKFRTRLGEYMEKHEMTRMDVVRKAEISYPTVSAWETDLLDNIAASVLTNLMELFDCDDMTDLIYLVEEENEK